MPTLHRVACSTELYESVEQAVTDGSGETITLQRWVDASTKLLLRERLVAGEDIESDSFYNYELQRRSADELPPDTFAVAAPPEGGETVDYATAPPEDPEETEEPPPTYEERYAEAREWREMFGFSTADDVIRATLDNLELEDAIDEYGIPLTPAEQTEMEQRSAAEEAAGSIVSQVTQDSPDTYAGLWIDQAGGGLVRVGFTENAEDHLPALRQTYPYPDRLRVFTAEWTLNELQAAAEQVAADDDDLADYGIELNAIRVREDMNAVQVGADAWTEPDRDYMVGRYGDLLRFAEEESPVPAASRRSWPIPPVFGGLLITSPSGQCSTGFTVAKPKNIFEMRILTAGHCARRGTPFRHKDGREGRSRFIGRVSAKRLQDPFDAALIKPSRRSFGTKRILLRPNRPSGKGRYQRITSTGSPGFIGGVVCFVGYSKPENRCGVSLGSDVEGVGKGQPCAAYAKGREVEFGDSGGPVFYARKAYGLVSIRGDEGRKMCWSPISSIEERFNVRVLGAFK